MRTMRAVLNEMTHNHACRKSCRSSSYASADWYSRACWPTPPNAVRFPTSTIHEELFDLMPGYLVFRSVVCDRPPTDETVEVIVDSVLIPLLKSGESGDEEPSGREAT